MPRPRTPKSTADSRDVSADESDATVDPAAPIQTRRTRKRPAHSVQEGAPDRSDSQLASRSHSVAAAEAQASATGSGLAERHHHAGRHRNVERNTANGQPVAGPSAFETPNQTRDRLAWLPSDPSSRNSIGRSPPTHRSPRSTRSTVEPPFSDDHADQDGVWRSSPMTEHLSSQSFSSRYANDSVPENPSDSADTQMTPGEDVHQQPNISPLQPLTIRTQNMTVQPQTAASPFAATTSMARSNSNMSPPRPTRSLPRRRASARTQTRPLRSNSSNASSSYPLRSRSTSSSNILAPSNSTANILASGHSRQSSTSGCVPLGGGFDPAHLPPSGMLTPRTPLAEIPLWLADMRSDSRRSSTSSTSFLDREDLLNAARTVPSRHARTVSTSSSSGPPSPGATRNGSTSPAVPFRRSLRGGRPRQSDENARVSPSPSYFGEYDALPSPSPSSFRGDVTPFDESFDPNATMASGINHHLGTASPSTPLVQLQQTSSPAMSTRSRTLNRAGSVRGRRLTNPLNTPVSLDPRGLSYETVRLQQPEPQSAFHQARSNAQERRTRNTDVQRTGTLLERRAATAAAASAAPAASASTARVASRPSSRTSSPAHGTRSSRRRSTAAEGQASSAMDSSALGPRPGHLPPLQIPSVRLAREAGVHMPGVSTSTSVIPERVPEEQARGAFVTQLEPVSPSAFSEMTSLTQGSTASESINSAGGMPVTPSSTISALDPFAQSVNRDTVGAVEAGGSDPTRRTPRKNPHTSRDPGANEEALGIQLRPRP